MHELHLFSQWKIIWLKKIRRKEQQASKGKHVSLCCLNPSSFLRPVLGTQKRKLSDSDPRILVRSGSVFLYWIRIQPGSKIHVKHLSNYMSFQYSRILKIFDMWKILRLQIFSGWIRVYILRVGSGFGLRWAWSEIRFLSKVCNYPFIPDISLERTV